MAQALIDWNMQFQVVLYDGKPLFVDNTSFFTIEQALAHINSNPPSGGWYFGFLNWTHNFGETHPIWYGNGLILKNGANLQLGGVNLVLDLTQTYPIKWGGPPPPNLPPNPTIWQALQAVIGLTQTGQEAAKYCTFTLPQSQYGFDTIVFSFIREARVDLSLSIPNCSYTIGGQSPVTNQHNDSMLGHMNEVVPQAKRNNDPWTLTLTQPNANPPLPWWNSGSNGNFGITFNSGMFSDNSDPNTKIFYLGALYNDTTTVINNGTPVTTTNAPTTVWDKLQEVIGSANGQPWKVFFNNEVQTSKRQPWNEWGPVTFSG